jgi:hypothetical protein
LGFDPFSAAFYLTSRYEEYLPYVKDRFGRFEARESFSYKMGFLKYPVVDHYAMMLRQSLSIVFRLLPSPPVHFNLFLPLMLMWLLLIKAGSDQNTLWKHIISCSIRYKIVHGNDT